MRINELKKNKSRLHRVIRFLVRAEFVLGGLAALVYINYLAFSSDDLFAIFLVAFADTSLVLVTLDIATSD
ncbi:MAG: hypothetical protein ACOCNX_00910 [Prevotella sp.]